MNYDPTVGAVLKSLRDEIRKMRELFERLANEDLELGKLRESRESGKTRQP